MGAAERSQPGLPPSRDKDIGRALCSSLDRQAGGPKIPAKHLLPLVSPFAKKDMLITFFALANELREGLLAWQIY